MFLHHSEDNTGKIEGIVDEKLSTSGFVNEEKVTEMIAEAQLEPVVPDVYLTKNEAASTYSTQTHTHTSFSDDLTVNGRITCDKDIITTGPTKTRYITISDESNADNKYSLFGENGNVILRNDITRDRTILYGTGNRTIDGNLTVDNKITTKYLEVNDTLSIMNSSKNDRACIRVGGTSDDNSFLEIASRDNGNEPIYIRQYKGNDTKEENIVNSITLLDASGNSSFPKNLNVSGDLYVKGVKIDGTSGGGGEFDPSILEPYATKDYVDTKIAEIPSGGGGGDVTKAYVDEQIATHTHNTLYYTKQEVDTKIAEIPSGGGSGGTIEVIDNDLTINGDLSVKGTIYKGTATPETITVTRQNTDDRVNLDIYSSSRNIYVKWSEIPYADSTILTILWADGTESSFPSTTDEFSAHNGDVIIEPNNIESGSYPGRSYKLRAFSSFNVPVQFKSLTVSWTTIPKPYATQAYVDEKIAEIPIAEKIEVIDNDLTINGNLAVTGLLENKLKTWQIYDDYVNWYSPSIFPITYEKHDDTSRLIMTIPRTAVNILHAGQQIDGEWLIQCYLDSEGSTFADFRYEFVHTFDTVSTVQINDNVKFEVTDDSYKIILDNTAFRWSQYYGMKPSLVSCKIYSNAYTTFRQVPDGDTSEIGVSNTNSLQVVMYDDNFSVARHILTLMDHDGHMSLPGDLTVPGTIYNKTMKNDGSGEVLQPYATQAYVDRKISDHAETANFAPTDHTHDGYATNDHTHDETYYTKTEVDAKIAEIPSPEIPSDLTVNQLNATNGIHIGNNPDGWTGWISVASSGMSILGNVNFGFGIVSISEPPNGTHKIKGAIDFSAGTVTFSSNVNFTGSVSGINETITHHTNVSGEIGTFCETNGGIYDGYEKIGSTDCICQVIQSSTLNAKIVGVITSENQFASHGDVLMKVVPGTYKLGDILAPDITGRARVATETELQYMMLHAIPRPKITSLNTGIANTVACFIV